MPDKVSSPRKRAILQSRQTIKTPRLRGGPTYQDDVGGELRSDSYLQGMTFVVDNEFRVVGCVRLHAPAIRLQRPNFHEVKKSRSSVEPRLSGSE